MKVSIDIYDLSGKRVATLVNNQQKAAGTYEVNWDVSTVSNGMYIASLRGDGYPVQSMKVSVAK
ncbi:MAG: hypothetical protein FD123_2581 [Bacteroidetes bacterium]|nr:MAG: hypothetical protein FD123_2581 [Bacteroidota bacterium]